MTLGQGIYWCARDIKALQYSPTATGNHHFILINDTKQTLLPLGIEINEYSGKNFVTLAAFKYDGKLVAEINNEDDIKSFKQFLKGKKSFDLDFEHHQIYPPSGQYNDYNTFIKRVADLAKIYQNKSIDLLPNYDTWKLNCISWVNSIFYWSEVPTRVRKKSANFKGLDPGSDIELSSSYFI